MNLNDLHTFAAKIYREDLRIFPQNFLAWKAESAKFFAFWMYEYSLTTDTRGVNINIHYIGVKHENDEDKN